MRVLASPKIALDANCTMSPVIVDKHHLYSSFKYFEYETYLLNKPREILTLNDGAPQYDKQYILWFVAVV